MGPPRRLGFVVALVALGAVAQAAATGRTVEVAVARAPAGLERFLPRDGAYGRALAALRAGELHRAADLFHDAAAEVRRAGAGGRVPPAAARALAAKVDHEAAEVLVLVAARREAATGNPLQRALREAQAWHNLYLTARAFSGRPDADLYQRAGKAYLEALERAPGELAIPLQIGWAGLLADGGHRRRALAELSRVPPEARTAEENVYNTAHVFAAVGDAERALDLLDFARDRHGQWAELRVAALVLNDFDPLRDDPRFARLVGADDP